MNLSLKISGVTKSFSGKPVITGLNLSAKSKDIIGIVGKSGCGKSTLLKILVGYLTPDEGSIFVNGENISKNIMDLRKNVGYTTQENSFYDKLSILENMRYYSNLYKVPGREREERIKKLLEQVRLYEHRKTLAENISGGMKRRLDFAISLLHNPGILVLDEPTAGLDPILIEQFWGVVKDVVEKEGKIVIMSSHILHEIERHCTKAAFMDGGKITSMLEKKKMKNLEQKFIKKVI